MILVVKVGNFSVLAYNLKCHFKDVPVEISIWVLHFAFALAIGRHCVCAEG